MDADHQPSAAGPQRLAGRPTWLLSRAAARSARLLADGFGAAGVRGYDYRLLAVLDERGPASQAELGRRAGIDRSDVVAALNDLEARGHVSRAPDPTDARRNVVTLTAAGRRALTALDGVLDAIQVELLAPLEPPERDQLIALLAKLVNV